MNKRSLTLVELLMVVCLIFVLIGMYGICFNYMAHIAKETALRYELNNVRSAITYYKIINNKLPADLKELSEKALTIETEYGINKKRIFAESLRLDDKGDLVDPFYNKYSYDSQTGRFGSLTNGYEVW